MEVSRVTEEKTNATSGISTVTVRESVAQQTIPQIKEQQAGKSGVTLLLKTQRRHLSCKLYRRPRLLFFLHSCPEISL